MIAWLCTWKEMLLIGLIIKILYNDFKIWNLIKGNCKTFLFFFFIFFLRYDIFKFSFVLDFVSFMFLINPWKIIMEPQLLLNYVIKKKKKINSHIGVVIFVVIWNVVSYYGAECEKFNLNIVDIGFCDCWIVSLLVLVDLHIWWMRSEHCS